jgi:hypothetical protein
MAEEGLLDKDELARIMKTELDLPSGAIEPRNDPTPPASDQPPQDSIQET